MKFKHGTRRRAAEYEKDWVQRWKENKTFEKSVENRPADNAYVFYDGPPFITGNPHHGTLLSSIVKDAVPRYQTMKGKRVERVWGWDCHGLPAENFVEKQLNITDRRQIVVNADDKAPLDKDGNELPTVTLEHYITKARESMVANSETWESVVDRVGRWVDFKGSYKTMDKNFMESVWWAFKQLYDKGKIYEGEKVLMYDTRFATPVSKNEVTMDNDAYQTVTDPSVFVKFKLDKKSQLRLALQNVWAKDTAHKDSLKNWSTDNISAGQCAITALLVNDIFGGEIAKTKVGEVGHYFNVIDGRAVDLTREQFGDINISYDDREVRTRERMLADEDTAKRYELLKSRLVEGWNQNTVLLAWTTTPWTLPANTALAVNTAMDYVEVELPSDGKKVYLISGKHACASDKYFVDLKNQLESRGHDVAIIDHIDPSAPSLDENLEHLNSYDFNDAHIIVHSLGASTFMKWLNDHGVTIASIDMIAPSYPGVSVGSNKEWLDSSGYVGFDVDFDNVKKKIAAQPTLIYSDDKVVRNENFEKLGKLLNARMVYEEGKGHFFEKEESHYPDYHFEFCERLILAKDLVEKVLIDEKKQPLEYKVLREMKGNELVGLSYEPLFGHDHTDESSQFDMPIVTLTDKDFNPDAPDFDNSKLWQRDAARAILENPEGKIALMHSSVHDYYKLPGGGIDQGESKKDALHRELMEEVGARATIIKPVGMVEEFRSSSDNMRQLSYAYYCQVIGDVGENHLEEGEKAEGFEVVWVSLDEAINLTAEGNIDTDRGIEMRFMSVRDNEILKKHKKQLGVGQASSMNNENAHKVWAADYVSAENGTGIVHLAPIYGEEDFELAKANDIPRVHVLDDNGFYYPEVASELYKLMPWKDASKPLEVWENNKDIAKGLKKADIVWKIDYVEHEYPFNPRSKQRIMYRAIPSWFFDIQGSKPLMLEENQNVNWFPEYLKNGRFAKNIEQAPDWNLSRDRFWATAMPVWKGDKGTVKVVGSYAELKELSGVELDDYHRPWVDDITFDIDGEHFTRIDKVLDCWFESGSMPFAQFHYPFENKEKFESTYPGDFIVEYVGQVRAWFYYVHTVNTALFGENAFKNVITTGTVAGNDGRKMSKSLGNYTDPNELMDKFSADSLRFLLLSSPLLNGEDFSLQDKDVGDVARKLSMVWNMYDFFTMYAEVDDFTFPYDTEVKLDNLTNPLDIWIVSRVHQLMAEVEKNMDGYNIPDAMSPILPFLDDASNWYVRRSRRRFWKSEDDGDKNDAYRTLHYVLVRVAYILAPFTPFLAEELYHNMTGDTESIHLKDWLPAGEVNQQVIDDMERTRELINVGLGLRMRQTEDEKSIKVRQPLPHMAYAGDKLDDYYEQIMAEELNVKEIKHVEGQDRDETWVEISKNITPELAREGMMREVIRHVQSTRKNAGLNVDDRIVLMLGTDDNELQTAINEHAVAITAETLAELGETSENVTDVTIDGAVLTIALQRKD